MEYPSKCPDASGGSADRRRSSRANPHLLAALRTGGEVAFVTALRDEGWKPPTLKERATLDFVAARDRAAHEARTRTPMAWKRLPNGRATARRRREAHTRTASPTRGSPDREGEPASPGRLTTLEGPLCRMHAECILRSADADGVNVCEYAVGVVPFLEDDPALLKMFGAALEEATRLEDLRLEGGVR